MDDDARERLTRVRALTDDAVLAAMLQAADAADLWDQLLPLVARMDAAMQQRAAEVAERQSAALRDRLSRALAGRPAAR